MSWRRRGGTSDDLSARGVRLRRLRLPGPAAPRAVMRAAHPETAESPAPRSGEVAPGRRRSPALGVLRRRVSVRPRPLTRWHAPVLELIVGMVAAALAVAELVAAYWPGGDEAPDLGKLTLCALVGVLVLRALVRWRAAEAARLAQQTEQADEQAQLQRLEDAYARQGRFLQIAAHEFKGPLTTILASAEIVLLRDAGGLPERARRRLGEIPVATRQLRLMIDNLLDQGRLERGSVDLVQDLVDFERLVQEALDTVAVGAQRERIVLDCAPHLPEVYGDATELLHAVINLLSNALKYSPPATPVHLRIAAQGDGVQIAVQDAGWGIPPADQARIFEPYFRGQGPAARRTRGTGLGLSITRETVHRCGGRITLESTLGQGSTFTIWLPAVGAAPRAPGDSP